MHLLNIEVNKGKLITQCHSFSSKEGDSTLTLSLIECVNYL